MPHLLSTDDLDAVALQRVRQLAREANGEPSIPLHVALIFLEPSLRTRVGFASAAVRLGGSFVEVGQRRWQAGMSEPETITDVVRVTSGMSDIVVVRTPGPAADLACWSVCPMINGGDGSGGHPSQALVDLVAIERFAGTVEDLHVGICGDLGSRAARSLVRLLGRVVPAHLTLVAPPARDQLGFEVPPRLRARLTTVTHLEPSSFDVLYLPGLPEGVGASQLEIAERGRYAVTEETLALLPSTSVVLSPMPVIDEISPGAREDPRVMLFETTDLSVRVRMELLALAADR